MPKYKVVWEIRQYAYIIADSAEEAIEKSMSDDIDIETDEITSPPEAYEE